MNLKCLTMWIDIIHINKDLAFEETLSSAMHAVCLKREAEKRYEQNN